MTASSGATAARSRFSARIMAMLTPAVPALVVAIALLVAVGADPVEALRLLWDGSFGSMAKATDTLRVWVPLALAAAGLIVTFSAGLWNIGVEGQVILGAVATTLVARTLGGPGWVVITVELLAAFAGGALWGLAAGVLRTHGRVNEIFGGLGLTFVASSLVTYLVLGPWAREGIASTSGTDLLPRHAWLPTLGDYSVSLVGLVIAFAAVAAVTLLLRGTRYGLRVKAVGAGIQSARIIGIPTTRYMLSAFGLGGGLAGLAGGILAAGTHYKLFPGISGGFGYLGILVALLAAFRARWVAPIALFFAAILLGSAQLQLRMGLNPSLGIVVQGVIVLFALLAGGWRLRRAQRAVAAAGAAVSSEAGPPARPDDAAGDAA